MNEKRLKRYISNIATACAFQFDVNQNPRYEPKKLQKYFLQGLRNYCKLRLDLMSKPEIIQVEQAIATAAMKAGLRYAQQKYNLNFGTLTTDEIIEEIAPRILDEVHNLRYDTFNIVLGYCNQWKL